MRVQVQSLPSLERVENELSLKPWAAFGADNESSLVRTMT